MSFLSNLFKSKPSVDFKALVAEGAIVVDVRSSGEYKMGHIDGSKNIPLDQLNAKVKNLPKGKTIITCCQSGRRSGIAKSFLDSQGFVCHNGGGWSSLRSKLK
ncbi:MAG: rhodanese-like domain-containing protein [Bacteroidia bacterium]